MSNQLGAGQPELQRQNQNNAINEAYEAQMKQVGPKKNSGSNYEDQKQRSKAAGSNAEQCVSSSLLSEKLDNRNMANFSNGNQKNIKFKNKFGEQHSGGFTQQQATSKSPQKNRLQTQPEPQGHN